MTVPKFWAGYRDDEEILKGGTGDTPDEAYANYVDCWADTDLDCEGLDSLQVHIYETVSIEDCGLYPEDIMEEWDFVLRDEVETRTVTRLTGQ